MRLIIIQVNKFKKPNLEISFKKQDDQIKTINLYLERVTNNLIKEILL